jgi:hypothetical protein
MMVTSPTEPSLPLKSRYPVGSCERVSFGSSCTATLFLGTHNVDLSL